MVDVATDLPGEPRRDSKLRMLAAGAANLGDADAIRPDLGVFNFEAMKRDLEDVAILGRAILAADTSQLPQRLIDLAVTGLEQVLARHRNIEAFDPMASNDPKADRHRLTTDFQVAAYDLADRLTPIVALARTVAGDREMESARRNALASAKELRDIQTQSASKLAELNEALRVARDELGNVGVSAHAEHFRVEAEASLTASKNWLIATGAAAAVVVAGAVFNYLWAITEPIAVTGPAVVQLVTAKILLFSITASVVVWCGRIYRANRHNYVVNKHRQNALSSLETFAQATDDDQTKNAVLLQATKSIFEPQSTGFVEQSGEPQPSTQLIEMWKAVGGGR